MFFITTASFSRSRPSFPLSPEESHTFSNLKYGSFFKMLAGIRATVPTYMSNMYSYAWYTLRLDRLQGLWTYRALGTRAASTSSNKVMKAWVVTSYEGFEKLTLSTTAEMPLIQNPDDVLVKVHASSVNPIDIKVLGKSLGLPNVFGYYT